MLRGGMNENMLKDYTKTVFINKNRETRDVEKAWIGQVFNFRKSEYKDRERIYFNVKIEKQIKCPSEYLSYSEGWYIDEKEPIDDEIKDNLLDPPFFSIISSTTNWREFEEYTYCLLRSVGLHNTYRFHPAKQKGKADGFFKCKNLAVIYDCTLDTNFEKTKATQIENFCDQMKKGSIEFGKLKINISNCEKRVWMITKEGNQRLIKQIDEIAVKEIPVRKIMKLYRKIIEGIFYETDVARELESL